MKVLWLAGWYPNKTEPHSGDFVQRHAQALSLHIPVEVIFVLRDDTVNTPDGIRVEERTVGNLSEKIIHYRSRLTGFSPIDRLLSRWKYARLMKRAVRNYIVRNGRPDLIHFYVAMKTAPIAGWVRKALKTKFVVTEHWTGFLPEAKPNFRDLSSYLQWKWRSMIKHAAALSVVSDYLGKCLSEWTTHPASYSIIPNVVNTDVFFPGENTPATHHFVHISGMDYQKNMEGILEALGLLKQRGLAFKLDAYGTSRPDLLELTVRLDLKEEVSFHGEVEQEELAQALRRSDAIILYSRYETFGCVVIESLACGVPAVVSDIPVMRERVIPGKNGVLVAPEDPVQLADVLEKMIKGGYHFDKDIIAKEAQAAYNFETVGKNTLEWYQEVKRRRDD